MTRATVTIAVAARNEEKHLPSLLDSLSLQTYDRDAVEVVIADGGSTDATRAVVETWTRHHDLRVRLIDNPGRVTASGLNEAIAASAADIVLILGAHAAVPIDFVERSVEALLESGADCAGGVLETAGATRRGRAIAAATTSPFGVGNARFRTGSVGARDVDTVAFGAYRRGTFAEVGGFDVSLVGAEDDELNFRIVRKGGRIRFDPAVRSTYFCRSTIRALARQYFMYGRGKAWVLKKHRRPPSVRMLVPAALIASMAGGVMTAAALRRWSPLVLPVAAYVSGIGFGTAQTMRGTARVGQECPSWWEISLALMTLHLSYGSGFVVGVVRAPAAAPSRSN